MNKLLCYLVPSLVSVIVLSLMSEKKKKLIDLFKYYIINTLIINFITIKAFEIRNSKNVKDFVFDSSLSIKYIIIATVIAILLPFVCKKLKKDFLNLKKKLIKEGILSVEIDYNKESLKRYIEKNREKVNRAKFILVSIIFFVLLDFIIRYLAIKVSSFSSLFSITSILMTLCFSILFTMIIYYLPKHLSKITAIITYLFWIILFLVHYFLLKIKSEALSIYDLNDTTEGIQFLNFIIKQINVKLIICLVILLFLAIYSFILLIKVKRKKVEVTFKKIFKLLLNTITIFVLGYLSMGNYEEKSWKEITYPKYYYNNFVNPKRSLSTLGIYEYTFRDLQLYFENMNTKFGSVEEIESYMNAFNRERKDNDYTGIFKDKNVIMIMMESIDEVVANKETMPTLAYMRENGWNFTKRYNALTSGGSTLLTEYTSMTGLFYDLANYSNINNNTYPYSLPNMMKKNGYKTISTHENNGFYYNRDRLHQKVGFENSYFLYDILEEPKHYQDDQFVTNEEIYNKIVPQNEKFMTFIVTIAAHGPYDDTNEYCKEASKTESEKECLSFLAKRTDDLLKELLIKLEKDNLLDDTIIMLYTDHIAYSYNYSDEDLKIFDKVDEDKTIKNVPFVIYNKNLKHKEFDNILVNDIDFVPTILNLFGIEYNPNYYMGNDIFDSDRKNLILFRDYSFYDGTTYSGNENVDTTSTYFRETQRYVNDTIRFGQMILSQDYYKYTLKK